MPLPEMHGRTHIPAGYAAVVTPTAAASFLPQATSDQIPCTTSGTAAIKSIVCTDSGAGEVLTPGNQNIIWQTNNNRDSSCFTPIIFSGSDYYQIRILEDGVYTATCHLTLGSAIAYGVADVAISMYRSDRGEHNSRRWTYDAVGGFNDAQLEWTFEMDGTGGSNRRVEWQFNNFHTPIGGTDDNLQADDIRIEIHKWPGTITL